MSLNLQGRGPEKKKEVPEGTTGRQRAEGDRSSVRPNPQGQTFSVFMNFQGVSY